MQRWWDRTFLLQRENVLPQRVVGMEQLPRAVAQEHCDTALRHMGLGRAVQTRDQCIWSNTTCQSLPLPIGLHAAELHLIQHCFQYCLSHLWNPEQFGLERTLKTPPVPIPAMGRDTSHQPRLLQAPSSLALDAHSCVLFAKPHAAWATSFHPKNSKPKNFCGTDER